MYWLLSSLLVLLRADWANEFIKTFRKGDKVVMLQRRSNTRAALPGNNLLLNS
jgi:hypothetical protein